MKSVGEIGPEQQRGRAVGQRDVAGVVEADDAGADPGQHGFGEPAAVVELGVGLLQCGLLLAQARGHAVEGAAQERNLVAVGAESSLAHPHRQIAAPDAFGGVDEFDDRPRRGAMATADAEPDGDQQQQHRDNAEQDGMKLDLEIGATRLRGAGGTRSRPPASLRG